MKKLLLINLMLIVMLSAKTNDYQYLSPKPGAEMITAQSNIIIRHSEALDLASISPGLISVRGDKSGIHEGEFILAEDAKTMVFNPYEAFADDELVSVQLNPGVKTRANENVQELSFSFKTAAAGSAQNHNISPFSDFYEDGDALVLNSQLANTSTILPAPPITVDVSDNPSPGNIFLATWDRNVPHQYSNYIFILDNEGAIVDSQRVDGAPFDFQVQPNGLLSYAHGGFAGVVPGPGEELQHMVLDASLTRVDSFKMKNGYPTDFHEFLLLPNGNAMLMSYHNVIYDMSQIVEGGRTDAILVLNILQEQDRNKNVVFEWRNIDHLPITDSDEDLTAPRINYSTLNAFSLDTDGNILASFRNHSEIMKISRATGEIMWRWGSPRGEITTIGEHEENAPYYFSRQHHIQRLPNGNVSLFDNGQFHLPPYSRAAEYELDEVAKTATLVSEFRYPSGNIFAAAAGNAQKLDNGGWFTGYGILAPPSPVKRNIIESRADGSIALEISLPTNVIAYRVSKSLWGESVENISVTEYEIYEGNTYSFNDATDTTGIDIFYTSLTFPGYYNDVTVTRYPYTPLNPEFFGNPPMVYPMSLIYEGTVITSQTSELHFDLDKFPEIIAPATASVYWREFPGQGLFIEIPTTYDSTNNELLASISAFGELVVGNPSYVYTANIPLPYEPEDQSRVYPLDSIALRWTGQGYVDSYQVQMATDSLFNSLVLDSTLKNSFVFAQQINSLSSYYWRVKSNLGSESSDWSPTWSFETQMTTGTEVVPGLISEYKLEQNYPNPFNPSTQISYSIAEAGMVSLTVFDVRGNEIETLVGEFQNAGPYSVNFSAGKHPAGIYFYRLQLGSELIHTRKMLLLK